MNYELPAGSWIDCFEIVGALRAPPLRENDCHRRDEIHCVSIKKGR
jgi:hypothetical protein